jgi:hypothetical protein
MAQRSLVLVADEEIPFPAAAGWAGLTTAERGWRHDCPRCGSSGAFRAYRDHAWCHSCRTYFTVTRLLAAAWPPAADMEPEDVARLALEKHGYVPLDYAHLWEHAQREPGLALDQLGEALRTWCAASIPDWGNRALDAEAAHLLARCLGLLPRCRTSADCEQWLARCKQVMGSLAVPGNSGIT